MTPLKILREQFSRLGYPSDAIVANYVFSDVFAPTPRDCKVSLAAFTRTPPSYRNAAFGVISAQNSNPAEVLAGYRALGAPLLFSIESDAVSVWKVRASGVPVEIDRASTGEIPSLFAKHATDWKPASIHRAKAIGRMDHSYQLDFVDIGLMPLVEGQVHSKLDRLLAETLSDIHSSRGGKVARNFDHQAIFRTVFRLLAAKILQDREHPIAAQWDEADFQTVLTKIRKHYSLSEYVGDRSYDNSFKAGWDKLRSGISFRNISADDLAFVYENTLVTTATRKQYGTHSTPRQVAEFVVNRLHLSRMASDNDLKVYEPFSGAGVFLVAAMSRLRDALSANWTDKQRHDYLVPRISGDEMDSFACEVARLSLILADYPNANGWKIGQADLFSDAELVKRSTDATVVLCNPPFEDFTEEEKREYPGASERSHSKSIFALQSVLDVAPKALGFVLPPIFMEGKKYASVRQRIEKLYHDVEIVDLPEHTFKASTLGSALLIAQERRAEKSTRTTTLLKSSGVTAKEREHFLSTGELSFTREETRSCPDTDGKLWIRELDPLWHYLANYPRFEAIAKVHRGLEWKGDQSKAISPSTKTGFVRGVGSASDIFQYSSNRPQFIDARPGNARGNAIALPWREPKLIASAVRRTRGMWNLVATIDRKRLVASQQLFGIWPKTNGPSLEVMCAILNGPVASAFTRDHSVGARLLVSAVESIPIPPHLNGDLTDKVAAYVEAIKDDHGALFTNQGEKLSTLLNEIDAAVLKAYDLPPKLEKVLLEQFRGSERPLAHAWQHWLPENFSPCLPLHEVLSNRFKLAARPWVQEVFKPLPEDEISVLREYMD